MRRLMFTVMLCLITITAAAQESLIFIDSTPLPGEELKPRTAITFDFNTPVQCETAVEGVTITPAIRGEFTCVDQSLIFTPAEDYQNAMTYSFTLTDALQAENGSRLQETIMLTFNTIGFLTVSEVIPAPGAAEVAAVGTITIAFNRPVVPLTLSTDTENLPAPLTIEPAIAGSGRWLNTAVYVFTPETILAPGTQYRVTVDKGLTTADGAVLDKPYAWTFTTKTPQITEVRPTDGTPGVLLQPEIMIYFNQPVDRLNIQRNFYLYPEDTPRRTVPGKFEWSDDSMVVMFKPSIRLKMATTYQAEINVEGTNLASNLTLSGTTSWKFTTVPYPSILRTSPGDDETGVGYSGFRIDFASPMDEASFEGKITVEPKPSNLIEYYQYASYVLAYPIEPNTTYTVTIAPGLKDLYGNVLEEGKTVTYTTAPPVPYARLNVPSGPIGFYNAGYDDTGLYLIHRNVSEVELNLYSVKLDDFLSLSKDYKYHEYKPDETHPLRHWTVQLDQAQKFTPDYLNISAANTCAGALPPRIKVGNIAVPVIEDGVAIFDTPESEEASAYLYPGSTLEIVSGPICADRVLWWEVEFDGSTGWAAEATYGRYQIEPMNETSISVSDNALSPGLYYLTLDVPDIMDLPYYSQRYHFMMVMNANLIMKSSVDEILVWATDVSTGKPIPDAPVTIYDFNQRAVASGMTDAEGLLKVRTPRINNLYSEPRTAVLQTETYFGLSNTSLADGIDPGWFGEISLDYVPSRYRVYVYTDRPVYRPGQEIHFRAVIRARDDIAYTLPRFKTVPVQILNNRAEVLYEKELPLSEFGTVSDSITLDAEASLGNYMVRLSLPSPNETSREGGLAGFYVAEYRLPEFQVTVTPETAEIAQGENLRALVEGNYYFGSPVSNGTVEYRVYSGPYAFNYTGEGYYQFGTFFDDETDEANRNRYSTREISRDTGVTDDQGKLLLDFKATLIDAYQSRRFFVEATVSDESNQSISSTAAVVVHAGQIYLGARPERYVGKVDQPMKIDLIAVDWDSAGIPDQPVNIEVLHRQWFSVQEMAANGRTTWTWDYEDTPVASGEVMTDLEGKAAFTFTPPAGGTFLIRLRSQDSLGNEVRGQAYLWVSSTTYVSWRQENNNRIELIADRERYQPGETAEILIASPFQGQSEAIVTVERGDVLSYERVTLESNSAVYRLPITEDHAPNIFVSVVVIKGIDDTNPVAAFRMGMVKLEVDRSSKEITLNIEADREKVQPGETVQYTLRATDHNGNPVQAEVGIAVTDLAALSLMNSQVPALIDFFYKMQGIGVRTTTPLTINTDQLTQGTLDMIKGGGGGGDAIFDVREKFEDTPYWNPSIVTDINGEATFEVTLPDNLTTWRLDARAITKNEDGKMLVGQTTHDIISTLPLIVRPVTPRFFVVGDQTTLAAVVNNNTDEDLTLTVSMDAEGIALTGDSAQTVTVAANTRARVEWNVTIEDVQQVEIIFSAVDVTGVYSDAARPAVGLGDNKLLPVYRYEAPETVGTAGMLREEGTRTESIALPRRFEVSQGNLTVKLQPSLAATTIDSLTYLETFPHACIEQTISAFLPNIMTYRALEELDLADPELKVQLEQNVSNGLQRLLALQHTDGGWGWFVDYASSPLTTSYALIALIEARRQGFTVPQEVIDNAHNFLNNSFVVPGLSVESWKLNRQAFVLYALARSGRPNIARTSTLYEHRERLNQDAQIYLMLTLHMRNPEDPRVKVLYSNMIGRAVVSATGTFWDETVYDFWNWTTDTRTTALALKAIVTVEPESDFIPNIVRWLITQRNTQAWESTQETAWSVMALTDWMKVSGELQPDYSYTAAMNGETLESGEATPENIRETIELKIAVSDLLQGEVNQLVFDHRAGDGILYYTAHLTASLPVPEIEPLNKGIILERWYSDPDDDERKPITGARVGELIQVNLTIVAPNALHYVVVDDPIPAGTEIVNTRLNGSQKFNTNPGFSRLDADHWYGWGWWWFHHTESRDEKMSLYTEYLSAGTYEYVYFIRAGMKGSYNVIPPTGQEFYFPEVYGRGAGSVFTVLPEE